MNYTVRFDIRGGVFAVPNDIVDKHIKMCSALHLKVLLIALRSGDGHFSAENAAAILGLGSADIADAANYWVQAGLFESAQNSAAPQPEAVAVFAPKPMPSPTQQSREAETGQKVTTIRSRSRMSTADINKLAKSDPNVSMLLQEFQSRLGKEMTPAESETTVWLYSYLGLSADYILMIAEYCKSIGKGNMRTIEKTAVSWFDSGIDTHDKAEAHIRELDKQKSCENRVKLTFGIHDRDLTSKEKEFVRQWCIEYNFGTEMLRLAYEKTVDQTGKVSFPYCGRILSSWFAAGIKTPQQASEEKKPQRAPAKNKGGGFSSFDLNEVENLLKNDKQ